MRVTWHGNINFGLTNIPVGLVVAQKRKDVGFRTLHRECGSPIKQMRYCPVHEADGNLEADATVKGFEYTKGEFLVVEEDEIDALSPEKSKSISIFQFCDVDEVDPIYFDRSYYLAPSGDEPRERGLYKLFHDALVDTGMAAVGQFVLWGKENLCLIRPFHDEALSLTTLYYVEDIREDVVPIEASLEGITNTKAERDMAVELVTALKEEFDPDRYISQHRMDVRELIEAKMAGKKIKPKAKAPAPTPKTDLLDNLKASIDAAKKEKGVKPKAKAKKPAARGRKKTAA